MKIEHQWLISQPSILDVPWYVLNIIFLNGNKVVPILPESSHHTPSRCCLIKTSQRVLQTWKGEKGGLEKKYFAPCIRNKPQNTNYILFAAGIFGRQVHVSNMMLQEERLTSCPRTRAECFGSKPSTLNGMKNSTWLQVMGEGHEINKWTRTIFFLHTVPESKQEDQRNDNTKSKTSKEIYSICSLSSLETTTVGSPPETTFRPVSEWDSVIRARPWLRHNEARRYRVSQMSKGAVASDQRCPPASCNYALRQKLCYLLATQTPH